MHHTSKYTASKLLLFQHAYFAEASRFNNYVTGSLQVAAESAEVVADLIEGIDAATGVTPQPTQTVTQDYASRSYARRLGDIGQITTLILSAVFFTVLIVAANNATQTLRERLGEYAALQTLGFSRSFGRVKGAQVLTGLA